MVDVKDIKQNLIILGLEDSEARIYIELLNHESLTVLEIASLLNIPRTTVYRICEKLGKKQFAEWIIKENSTRIKAVKPTDLKQLIESKREEVISAETALKSLESMISTPLKNLPGTQVRYYQGKEGLRQMMWNCLKAKDEIVGWSVYGRASIIGESFMDSYVNEFKRRKLGDRAIMNEKGLEYNKIPENLVNHQQTFEDMRFIPESKFYIAGDTSIYNNVFAYCVWNHGEVIGVEIENPEIVKTQRSIFNILWEIAEPVENILKTSN